ncbi:hypothetical protein [Achromobacter xylosoxidans]|uniref:hypothetical protein n=1 Tax=Alcaligenes xylosoxydans xylosoxydans TaxID=85698 RepID=UPI0006BF6BA5|nr:hypothetical protein [Achromobacter xylosoxidans]CUJ71711.1 Uncharacterised protein [Achromobacter xylosoxidans]
MSNYTLVWNYSRGDRQSFNSLEGLMREVIVYFGEEKTVRTKTAHNTIDVQFPIDYEFDEELIGYGAKRVHTEGRDTITYAIPSHPADVSTFLERLARLYGREDTFNINKRIMNYKGGKYLWTWKDQDGLYKRTADSLAYIVQEVMESYAEAVEFLSVKADKDSLSINFRSRFVIDWAECGFAVEEKDSSGILKALVKDEPWDVAYFLGCLAKLHEREDQFRIVEL